MIVILLAANHHSVAGKRPHAAHVRIVRRADPREGIIVAILVEVDALPPPIRIVLERVRDIGDGILGMKHIQGAERNRSDAENLQELAPR